MRKMFLLISLLAFLSTTTEAASVGGAGLTNAFPARPSAADWSTFSVAGASGSISNLVGLDVAVQTNLASGITAQLNSSNANPPNAVGPVVWCTNGYVQTRPTGNAFTLLLGQFVNITGSNVTAVTIILFGWSAARDRYH